MPLLSTSSVASSSGSSLRDVICPAGGSSPTNSTGASCTHDAKIVDVCIKCCTRGACRVHAAHIKNFSCYAPHAVFLAGRLIASICTVQTASSFARR